MLSEDYYKQVLNDKPVSNDASSPTPATPPGGTKDAHSPNYTDTNDPDVKVGKFGVKITKGDMDYANKHGMAWADLPTFADWLGGWAKQMPDFSTVKPYYRTYPKGTIDGQDVALLMSQNDPKINAMLNRNIAPDGEVPQFGPEDSDNLRTLIQYYKKPTTAQLYQSLITPSIK